MRNKRRISIVLNLFKNNIKSLKEFTNTSDKKIVNIYKNYDVIKAYWKVYPDQRFGQVLINLGLITNNLIVWHKEEDQWLIQNKYILPEEILFWGSNYDKDMNALEETKYSLLKDLTTDHIKNIISFVGPDGKFYPGYLEYFNQRIENEV